MKACVRHGGSNDQKNSTDGIESAPSTGYIDDAAVGEGGSGFQNSLRTMQYGNDLELESAVYSIAAVIETRLLRMVQDRFHLSVHLSALKKFLLLGQVCRDANFTCVLKTV